MTDKIDEKIERLRAAAGLPEKKKVFITLEEAFKNPEYLKEPEKVSPWLCWRGRTSLFVGEPAGGKSWIACGDALEAVRNGKKVLYVNIDEPPSDLIRRFKKYGDPRLLKMVKLFMPMEGDLEWGPLIEEIKEFKPDVVYLDSWEKIVGQLNEGVIPEMHQNAIWRRITDQFVMLSRNYDLGLCVLIHTTKSNKMMFSGNQQIMAAVDISINIVEVSKSKRKLLYGKRIVRDPVVLEWMRNTDGSMREAAEADDDQEAMNWILEKLEAGDLSIKELVDESNSGPQYTEYTIKRKTIPTLKKEGLVETTGRGYNTKFKITQPGKNKLKENDKQQRAELIKELTTEKENTNALG